MSGVAKLLIAAGAALLLAGVALAWAPWLFSWFGRLPGDIRIERPGGSFHFPITSMLLASVVLSVVINLWLRR